MPLDYTTPAAGVGTNATIDIVVSMGGIRDFRLIILVMVMVIMKLFVFLWWKYWYSNYFFLY